MRTTVISLGGSIIVPDSVDNAFISRFVIFVRDYLQKNGDERFVLVAGGGAAARNYQKSAINIAAKLKEKDCAPELGNDQLDMIGIAATRVNAELLRALLADLCDAPLITDPSIPVPFSGRVLLAAGWKPGFSTDYDAVLLAEQFAAERLINLSNIKQVYDKDPNKEAQARPLKTISWRDFRKMVGDNWTPGMNLPFDPVAAKKAADMGLTVICADGRNIDNFADILHGRAFVGTTVTI